MFLNNWFSCCWYCFNDHQELHIPDCCYRWVVRTPYSRATKITNSTIQLHQLCGCFPEKQLFANFTLKNQFFHHILQTIRITALDFCHQKQTRWSYMFIYRSQTSVAEESMQIWANTANHREKKPATATLLRRKDDQPVLLWYRKKKPCVPARGGTVWFAYEEIFFEAVERVFFEEARQSMMHNQLPTDGTILRK